MTTTLLLLAALASPRPLRSNSGDAPPVVVRIYDSVGIAGADLHEAESVSAQIVSELGIRLTWKACAPAGSHVSDPCAGAPSPEELMVRVLDGGSDAPPAVLGSAHVPGILATLFVDRVGDVARRNKEPMALLLGGVMAHELVHLLLGSQGHAAQGLMQATWTDADIRRGWIWMIGRSDDDRRTIAAAIRGRLARPPITVAQGSRPDSGK